MIYEPPTEQIQVLLEVEAQALVLRDPLHETTTSLAAVTNLFHGRATSGKQIDAFFPSAGSREETILISTDTITNLQVTNLPLSMPNHFT